MPITTVKGEIANALTSIAPDHILGVTHDIYDEDMQKYQDAINRESVDATALGYPTFSVTDSYAVGDIVFYIRKLYKFTSAHAAGAWNSSHVEEYSVEEAINTFGAGIYDVTANNNGATFASLSALLSSQDLSTLIPTSIRKGGMSIKFVQSSDNKYLQFRYMSTSTVNAAFTNVNNWQGVDEKPTVESKNLVESGGVESRKATVKPGKNLFNPNTSLEGYYIVATGGMSENQNYNITDYIKVSEGEYHLSGYNDTAIAPNTAYINLYDATKTRVNTVAVSKSLAIPSNVSYIRVTYYATGTQIQIESGDSRTAYVEYNPVGGYKAEYYAEGSVDNSALANNSVGTSEIIDGSVTEAKINDGAVIVDKLYTLPKNAITNTLDSYGYEISIDNASAYDTVNPKNYVRIPVGTKVTNNGIYVILKDSKSGSNRYDLANGDTWTATFEVGFIQAYSTAGNVRLSIEGKGFELKDGQVTNSKIANNAVTTNIIKDGSVTSSKVKDNTIVIDNVSSEIITIKQSRNLLDISALTNGYFINSNGALSSATSTYNITNFIKVKPNTNYYASNYYGAGLSASSSTYFAFYDENKNYIENSAVQATTGTLTSPANAKYIRLTVSMVAPVYQSMLEEGTSRGTYEAYWIDKKINKDLLYEKAENHSLILESSSLAASASLIANNFPQYIKVNHIMGVSAKITTFDELYIGLPSYKLHITSTKANIENANGGKYSEQNHGLTIEDYIGVVVKFRLKGVDYIINTKGGTFKFTYTFTTDSGQTDCSGKPYISLGASTSLTDVKFSSTCDGFTKPIWILGDSMTSVFSVRWTWYPVFEWGYNTFLLQGLSGGSSADLWTDLNKSLALGKPKTLVWMLGANDSDEAYQSKLDEVCNYCDDNNIELILVNFPDFYGMSTDSKKSSAVKNAYMLTKNRRYVDFRKAVSSNTIQVIGDYTVNIWYGDDYSQETPPEGSYIGSDRVHPTELGAKAEAVQILTDVPEITNN